MYSPDSRTSAPAVNAPAVVLVLIGAFAVIHAVRMILPEDLDLWTLIAFAFIPARYVYGPDGLPGGVGAAYWSFATHMFLHGSWAHLLVNSFWMLAFGSVVARRLGPARFLALSLFAGVAGAAVHLVIYWGEFVPVIGASAAISGQMAGAMRFIFADPRGLIVAMRTDPRDAPVLSLAETFRNPRAMVFLMVWLGINLLFGLGSLGLAGEGVRIAWEAHIAGFFAGLFAFGPLDPWPRRPAVRR